MKERLFYIKREGDKRKKKKEKKTNKNNKDRNFPSK